VKRAAEEFDGSFHERTGIQQVGSFYVHLFQKRDEVPDGVRGSTRSDLLQKSGSRLWRNLAQEVQTPQKGEPDPGMRMKSGFSGEIVGDRTRDGDTRGADRHSDRDLPKIVGGNLSETMVRPRNQERQGK
jgi:hypothetical protein